MKRILSLVIFCLTINISSVIAQCTADYGFSANNLTVQFLDSSTSSPNFVLTYFWDFGDGNVSSLQNPSHTYSSPGTYFTCLTIQDTSNTCFDSICYNVTVTRNLPQPCMANFTYSVNPNNSVNFFGNVMGGTAPYSYSWDFGFGPGSGSTILNPTYSFPSSGAYGVTLTITDANGVPCSFFDTVNVNNSCNANFSHQFTGSGIVSFSNLSTPIGANVNFSWDFGDGAFSNSTNPVHSYGTVGDYAVRLLMFDSSNNCSSQAFDSIYVRSTSNCLANFTFSTNNDTLFIQNLAGNYNLISYDFGDGSSSSQNAPSLTHLYSQSGTYIVCQTVEDTLNNCTDTSCDTVTVTIPPSCKAGFTFSVNDNVVSILNRASNYTSISYDLGDGTVLGTPNPMYTYAQSGTYIICQTVSNSVTNCSDTFCDTVVVVVPPPCQAGFTFTSILDTVVFQSTALNFTSISYDFGDGTSSTVTNPTHIYSNPGDYIVCQTVTSAGCTSTFCDTVSIRIPAPCQAGFSSTIVGDTAYFTATANSFNRVVYYFGDGDSSAAVNPIHDYQNSGTYQVTQVVYNDTTNCVDSITQSITITVSFSCVAKYDLAIDTNDRGKLYLVNTSSDDGSHSYFWDFGDGSNSTARLPTHQFGQNIAYKICLTVSDSILGCTSTYCDSVGLDTNGNILKSSGFQLIVIDGSFIGLEEESILMNTSVYPNPFSSHITIELEKSQHINYQLIQMNGQIVREGFFIDKRQDFSLEEIESGVYFLRLFDEKNTLSKKIIKQ